MVSPVLTPLILLFASALAVPLVSRLGTYMKFPKIRDIFSFAALLLSLYMISSLLPSVPLSYQVNVFGGPYGVELYVSTLSVYIGIIALVMLSLVSFYSIKYMEVDNGLDSYYTLLLTFAAGIVGVVFSGDFFTLYVFWELLSISSYSLVSFRKYRWQAVEGGIKYLFMGTVGSLIALYGISLLYGVAGTLNFSALSSVISTTSLGSNMSLYIIIATIFVGFGVSSAIVPFHTWIPDAYVGAPNCVASLSTVALIISAFSIIRSLMAVFSPFSFDYGLFFIFFGILSLTLGNFMAIMQRDVRRLLAFSSVSNMGYIFTGVGIGSYALFQFGTQGVYIFEIAMVGVFLHMLNHVFGKGLLFMAVGNFSQSTKSYLLDKLEGIGRRMPITGLAASIGLLGLAGIPPLSGFWSKLFFISAAGSKLSDPVLDVTLVFLVFNSIFDAAYYIWVFQRIAFKPVTEKSQNAKEVSYVMWLPILILAALLIIVTVRLDYFTSFIDAALRSLFKGA
ncbi:MAG: proton-conducting transporter membrane subunit [Nitrososphaeria archaeon]|jgi:proton-translocating NADH-quinone oxidoreductase chain N